MSHDAQLLDWLTSMGISQHFGKQDIESGKTVVALLRATNRDCKIQLQNGNSAIVRVNNWNAIIQYLKGKGIKLNQEEKGKIINGNHDLVFKIISKLRQIQQKSSKQTQINLKDIDPKKDVRDAQSLLELFLLAIIKHFSLSAKEALSLLSNDCKYLAHILAKGLKNDFRPIDALILEFSRNIQKILGFSKNKQNQLFFLKSIKPALISKSQSVSQNTLNLLNSFLQNYDKDAKLRIFKEHLTPTLMLILRRHPQLSHKVIGQAMEITNHNSELLSDMVDNISKNDISLLFTSIWKSFKDNGKKKSLQQSSAFATMVDQLHNGLEDPQLTLGSLRASVQLAVDDFDVFDRVFGEKLLMVVREIVFSREADNLDFVHILFCLMERSGQQKHPLAPVIYKLLTSRIANAGQEQYQVLISCFRQFMDDLPSIPPTPVIEALSQRSEVRVDQLQMSLFVKMLSIGAEARVGVAIYNLASRSFVQQTGIGRQLTFLLVQILNNFKEEQILLDMTGKLVKVCLALYFANAKKLSERRKPLSHKTKPDSQEAGIKLKMMEIQFFLKRVVELGQKQINGSAEPLLCFSCLQLAALGKEHSRGLQKVVALLGDPNKLLNKYEKQLTQADQTQKKSRVHNKHHSPSPQASAVHDTQGNTTQLSSYNKSPDKRIISATPQLHPMSLSVVAVKPDAYLGLQKSAKMHQIRSMAEESKRYQAMQKADDMVKQKKIMEKKVAYEKGLRLKGVADGEQGYLFEFDSKEVYAQSNQLNLNSYSPEAEEERDTSGVDQAIKRYEKALKVYFKQYSGHKDGTHTKYFHEMESKKGYVHSSSVFKLLRDHGMESYITPREVKTLARRTNYKLKTISEDPQLLDFQGFKQMAVQMSFTIFTRQPKDLRGRPVAEMLQEFFSMLKLYASENKVNVQLFEEPQSCFPGQQQALKQLNKRLQQNPDYIVPEGYKKITETRMIYDHKIYLEAMSPTYKDVYEVLDQILFQGLKFHVIQPFTQELKLSRARPNIYALEWSKLNEVQTKHLPLHLKKQVAKFPMKERPIAKDAALALADIVQAVELNHDEVGIKHENPYLQSKREKEEELRRAKEQAETKRLNATRQLRSAIDTFKDKRDEKTKKLNEQKQEMLRKKKEKQQKNKLRDKQLKSKLEQFNEKKKEEEQAKKESEKARKQKEKADAEKRKKDHQQTKRKLQELKKQKEEEEKERKEQEEEEQKRKKQQQKRKFEKEQAEKKQKVEEFKLNKKRSSVTKAIDGSDSPQKEREKSKSKQKEEQQKND